MGPNLPTMSAATPATAGEAIDVPAAHEYDVVAAPDPRDVDITMSNTQQNCTTGAPPPIRFLEHTELPGRAESPPGPARSIIDCPKFVYEAGRSRFAARFAPQPIGPVAATVTTPTLCAGTETTFAL